MSQDLSVRSLVVGRSVGDKDLGDRKALTRPTSVSLWNVYKAVKETLFSFFKYSEGPVMTVT